jgi:hypothetical protein
MGLRESLCGMGMDLRAEHIAAMRGLHRENQAPWVWGERGEGAEKGVGRTERGEKWAFQSWWIMREAWGCLRSTRRKP